MQGKCIVSSCGKAASKCCGACGLVRYCSTDCQTDDWKKHHKKAECVNMKKLSTVSLTEKEIAGVAGRVSNISVRLVAVGEPERSVDLFKECIKFVRDRLSQLDCHDSRNLTGDGVRLNHLMICGLLVDLGEVYFHMPSSSETDNLAISYISEARELLVQRKDAGIDDILMWQLLWSCDSSLYRLYSSLEHVEKAKYHAVESVASARQCKGPMQVDCLVAALLNLSWTLSCESKLPEAHALAEEAYILASKHYSPAHKTVLKAGSVLIHCLIVEKDYSSADTYCRINYANLIDPMNAGQYDMEDEIDVMDLIAKIWLQKEPDEDKMVEKALADEAIDLSIKMYAFSKKSPSIRNTTHYLCTLCKVLVKGNRLTEETEGLLHKLIAENNLTGDVSLVLHSLELQSEFYWKLNELSQMGEKSTLVQQNIEL